MADSWVVREPTIRSADGWTSLVVPVDGPGPDTLSFTVPDDQAAMLGDTIDAAVAMLLVPAMRHGIDLRLEAPVSGRLVWGLTRGIVPMIGMPRFRLRPVEITAAAGYHPDGPSGRRGVATGFSGGVDSFATVAEHHLADDVPPAMRLTHLVFMEVGSHGDGPDHARLGAIRHDRVRATAERLGLPVIHITSDAEAFHDDVGFLESHAFRIAAVGLALDGGLERYLHSNGLSFVTRPGVHFDTLDTSATATLQYVRTERAEVVAVGDHLSRVDKTRLVSELPVTYDSLDVCVSSRLSEPGRPRNCSRCVKCRRTLLALDALGRLDRYASVFDLEVWQRQRDREIARVLAAPRATFHPELLELLAERGVVPGPRARAEALARRARDRARRLLRSG